MKKWILGVMAALMAVSLAACTPTPEKQKTGDELQLRRRRRARFPRVRAGLPTRFRIPMWRLWPSSPSTIREQGDSLVQDMDSLESEEIDAQMLVSKLMDYGVLTDGTMVQTFAIQKEGEEAIGTLDLNQAVSGEGVSDAMFLTEIGNTFIENFELSQLKLTVNGENYQGTTIQHGDDDYLTYVADYDMVE